MCDRITSSGKFFSAGNQRWDLKGFSYGPFAPRDDGQYLPDRPQILSDLAHMRELGATAFRVYYPPSRQLLDDAMDQELRVFVDVPWEKHRCFFEDWEAQQQAIDQVRQTAKRLGDHPGLFAISVGNEIPVDIVRFYGHRRVGRFINRLVDVAKQAAPDCLTTYVNFPTTEFLEPDYCDFCCFNVYIHDEHKLSLYLDRLQHIAGNKPLVLGEYGIDTIREGDVEQAEMLTRHLRQVARRGLAGSCVFAYTDDWFTGGSQIEDWAFGVTRVDRTEKPSAKVLQKVWSQLPHPDQPEQSLPKVSIVVCSYNGASTLHECLQSLQRLNYPNYETILVDDGSQDATSSIARQFPGVIYHHQENRGLSVARNVGADLATGDIVAYTDDDCVADQYWLRYLVQAMQDQAVEAIGGPNITPSSDGWVANCVAASPGNPSHVMLDDRRAEHVPGCNMAFRRSTLLSLGGFDDQFQQAGDDVDVCWRFIDAGYDIGYAPGAMVWHHRRATVSAYAKQQKGYGRSEAMVHFKHPQRFGRMGRSSWRGIIYGDGAVGLPLRPKLIYHGRFGGGLFQTIYRHNHYDAWSCVLSLEWHLIAVFFLILATMYWPLLFASGVMWFLTAAIAVKMGLRAPLPKDSPWWTRPLVTYLYLLQPILRGWYRLTHSLRQMRLPLVPTQDAVPRGQVKRICSMRHDLYWQSDENLGREQLLEQVVEGARDIGFRGDFDNAWANWDVKLVGDRWHDMTIRTATEELGWPKRFTRARCTVRPTDFSRVVIAACMVWGVIAGLTATRWALFVGIVAAAATALSIHFSRKRCLHAATKLLAKSGRRAKLKPVIAESDVSRRSKAKLSGMAAGQKTTQDDDSGIVRV